MKELRRMEAFGHRPLWQRLTDSTQSPISELQGMERAIITRSPLTVTKLFGNGVVRVIVKPKQGNTVILEAAMSHA